MNTQISLSGEFPAEGPLKGKDARPVSQIENMVHSSLIQGMKAKGMTFKTTKKKCLAVCHPSPSLSVSSLTCGVRPMPGTSPAYNTQHTQNTWVHVCLLWFEMILLACWQCVYNYKKKKKNTVVALSTLRVCTPYSCYTMSFEKKRDKRWYKYTSQRKNILVRCCCFIAQET